MVRKSQRSQTAYFKKYYAKNIQEAARVLGETKQDCNKEAYQAHQKSIHILAESVICKIRKN